MKRYAAAIDLVNDADRIAAYLAHHRAVWPEVIRSFRAVGVRDMRIWRVANRLFMEMETEDAFEPARDFARYAAMHPGNPVWETFMTGFQAPLACRKPGEHWAAMELAFDFEAHVRTLDTGAGMRVDSHQHFWNYTDAEFSWIPEGPVRRSFGPEDLKPLLSARSIHGCVAVQARCDERENDHLLALADAHPHILGVVGWLDLAADNLDARLDAQSGRRRLVGFREILQGKPRDAWFTENFVRGVRRLGERGYAYDILVFANQLRDAHDLAARCHPDQRLVLDHLAKPDIRAGEFTDWSRGIRALAKDFPNLHCKLSGLVTEAAPFAWTPAQLRPYMETVVDAFGPDRVMYGSDWPVCLLAAKDYAAVHDVAADFARSLGAETEAKIMGANAARFYRLAPASL